MEFPRRQHSKKRGDDVDLGAYAPKPKYLNIKNMINPFMVYTNENNIAPRNLLLSEDYTLMTSNKNNRKTTESESLVRNRKRPRTCYKFDPLKTMKLSVAIDAVIGKNLIGEKNAVRTVSNLFNIPYNTLRDNYLQRTNLTALSDSKKVVKKAALEDIKQSHGEVLGVPASLVTTTFVTTTFVTSSSIATSDAPIADAAVDASSPPPSPSP